MRALALILALGVGSSALAEQPRPRRCLDRRDRRARVGCGDGTVLSFAPASGVGLPSVAELCGQAAGEMTGTFWCLKGDGTTLAGSGTILPQGSPVQQALPTCPNGTDCAAVNVELTPTISDYFTTSSVSSPAGDFSICWLGRPQLPATVHDLIGRDTGGAGRAFYLTIDSTNRVDFTVFKSAGGLTALNNGGSWTSGARHLFCGTYDFIADGTSIARVYQDGAEVQNSTTAVGPIQANTQATGINERPGGFANGCLNCLMEAAFYTEKAIDAATISALAEAVLARTPKSTQGHPLTVTRASAKFCSKSDGSAGTIVPSNRVCIRNGGAEVEGASTNLCIRSAAFDHAAWTKTNVSAVTGDTALAPDGTRTAESLTSTSGGGYVESTAAAITGSLGTVSVYVRTASGTQAVAIRLRDTTAAADRCTGTLTANTTWQRLACSSAAITTTNTHAVRIYPGDTAGTGTAIFWGAQMEADADGSSYIATSGTSATRSIDLLSFASSIAMGMSPLEGCTKLSVIPGWSGNNPRVTDYLINLNAATTARVPYINGNINDFRGYDGTHISTTSTYTATAGTPFVVRTSWTATGNLFRVNWLGGTANPTAFTTLPAFDQVHLGELSGSGAMPMVFKDVTLGSNSQACGSAP